MTGQPEIGVSRFRSDEAGRVTADAMQAWHREGLLVIEDFVSLDQCRQLISAADALVEDFDEEEVAAIFSTTSQQHAASEYFETSGDKIRCFLKKVLLMTRESLQCLSQNPSTRSAMHCTISIPCLSVFLTSRALPILWHNWEFPSHNGCNPC